MKGIYMKMTKKLRLTLVLVAGCVGNGWGMMNIDSNKFGEIERQMPDLDRINTIDGKRTAAVEYAVSLHEIADEDKQQLRQALAKPRMVNITPIIEKVIQKHNRVYAQ